MILRAEIGITSWRPMLAIADSQTAIGDRAAGSATRWHVLRQHPHLTDLHGDLWAQALVAGDLALTAEAWRLWETASASRDQARIAEQTLEHLIAAAVPETALAWALPVVAALPEGQRLGTLERLLCLIPDPEAQRALLESQESEPGIGPLLGQLYLDTGDWSASETLCQALLAAGEDLGFAHLGLGTVRLRLGDLAGAEAALLQASEFQPENPSLWVNLGLIAMNRQELDTAETRLRRATDLRPDHLAANLNLVRTAWWRQDLPDALASLNRVVTALTLAARDEPTAAAAMRDLTALHTYFREWERTRQPDPAGVVPAGIEPFLAVLFQAWERLSAADAVIPEAR